MANESVQTTARPVFTSISAQLFVADIKASFEFFIGKLGFVADFAYGDPPFYGQVSRDNARLNLRLISEPVFANDTRRREGLLSRSITVAAANEIIELFLEYQAAELPFHQALKKEPWGSLTFVISNPDGNLLLFAGPAD